MLVKFSSVSFVALLMASSLSSVGYAQTALPAPEAFAPAHVTTPVSHKAKKIAKKEAKSVKKASHDHKVTSAPAVTAPKASLPKVAVKSVSKTSKPAVTAKKVVKTAAKPIQKELYKGKKAVKKQPVPQKPLPKRVAAIEDKKDLHVDPVNNPKKSSVSKVVATGVAAASVATATAVAHHNAVAEVTKKALVPEPTPENTPSASIEDDRPVVEEQPTYAFLKTRMVNMRRGPGEEYPIDWVYSRRGLPVKVLVRYRMWRKVVDPYGTTGWMKLITLHMGRHFVVTGQKNDEAMPDQKHLNQVGGSPLIQVWVDPKANPAGDEVVMYKSAHSHKRIAYLKPGVVGQILRCKAASKFCDVKVDSYIGSILKSHIWGIEKNEDFEAVKPSFFR